MPRMITLRPRINDDRMDRWCNNPKTGNARRQHSRECGSNPGYDAYDQATAKCQRKQAKNETGKVRIRYALRELAQTNQQIRPPPGLQH